MGNIAIVAFKFQFSAFLGAVNIGVSGTLDGFLITLKLNEQCVSLVTWIGTFSESQSL